MVCELAIRIGGALTYFRPGGRSLALPSRHASFQKLERNRLSFTGAWHRAAAGDGLMWGGDVPEISVHNSTHLGDEEKHRVSGTHTLTGCTLIRCAKV
jgi:hypothetical protein